MFDLDIGFLFEIGLFIIDNDWKVVMCDSVGFECYFLVYYDWVGVWIDNYFCNCGYWFNVKIFDLFEKRYLGIYIFRSMDGYLFVIDCLCCFWIYVFVDGIDDILSSIKISFC